MIFPQLRTSKDDSIPSNIRRRISRPSSINSAENSNLFIFPLCRRRARDIGRSYNKLQKKEKKKPVEEKTARERKEVM